jgi:hypothetical protein
VRPGKQNDEYRATSIPSTPLVRLGGGVEEHELSSEAVAPSATWRRIAVARMAPRWRRHPWRQPRIVDPSLVGVAFYKWIVIHHVRLLVSARLIQPANSVFPSQQTSISQPRPAQKSTSEHADCLALLCTTIYRCKQFTPPVYILATSKQALKLFFSHNQ